jgi:hypothetical protein
VTTSRTADRTRDLPERFVLACHPDPPGLPPTEAGTVPRT